MDLSFKGELLGLWDLSWHRETLLSLEEFWLLLPPEREEEPKRLKGGTGALGNIV